eukprot:6151410-Amphidinium_carterae.2
MWNKSSVPGFPEHVMTLSARSYNRTLLRIAVHFGCTLAQTSGDLPSNPRSSQRFSQAGFLFISSGVPHCMRCGVLSLSLHLKVLDVAKLCQLTTDAEPFDWKPDRQCACYKVDTPLCFAMCMQSDLHSWTNRRIDKMLGRIPK